jgi:hypothetical protein
MLATLLAVAPLVVLPDPEATGPGGQAASLATRALSAKIEVSADEIELLRAVPVHWTHEVPGCHPAVAPRPETPANGYRVLLRAQGRIYVVQVGAGRAVVCGEGLKPGGAPLREGAESAGEERPPIPLPKGRDERRLVEQAREDLAGRLSLPVAGIQLVEFQDVRWPDSSLGCPRPGMAYTQVVHEGFRIGLRADKRIFEYHSGGGPPFLCETPAPR